MDGTYALAFGLGYLFGSVPFGLVFARLGGLGDIRRIGSGNIGATNALRTGSWRLALATLVADLLKGTVVTLLAALFTDATGALLAAAGCMAGHIFPIWLKFKGGKGVATFAGTLLGLHWPLFVAFAAIWLMAAALWRYSSLAALAATVITIIGAAIAYGEGTGLGLSVMGLAIVFTHRDNIARLARGAETRIVLKKPTSAHGSG